MSTNQIERSLPRGFAFAGICAGLKQEEHRKDLGLIVTEKDATVGAVYTLNRFPSAHVQYCREKTPNSRFRGLIINSGNANAATGAAGINANLRMAESVARRLGVENDQVLTSSTGIIGRPFPIDTIEAALDSLFENLGQSPLDTAEAIMTTDTRAKLASAEITTADDRYSVLGFAKGSGMIHPNMGTMLSFIMTDAPLAGSEIQALTEEVADKSFNCVSVDGDCSTNDSFFLISSQPAEDGHALPDPVRKAILEVAVSLARQIAADGEGAEHLMEVTVSGVPDNVVAHAVLNAVLTSNLVKTAVNGRDPNWGRILMAVGNGLKGTSIAETPVMSIAMQGTTVFEKGEPQPFDEETLSGRLADHEVKIAVNLHQGEYSLTGWGCDLSDEYVRINADYST